MSDMLAGMVHGLKERKLDVTVEELCDALWLCQRGVGSDARRPDRSPGLVLESAPDPGTERSLRDRRDGRFDSLKPDRSSPATSSVFLRGQLTGAVGRLVTTSSVRLPDSAALPHIRELARALRPLRYDTRRTHLGQGIDESETAHRIAQTGIRLPVRRTTRRRRLDLDLVLDLGGSGMLWNRLARELRAMLEIHGAFRSVRPWCLETDSAHVTMRPWHSNAVNGVVDSARYSSSALCQPPRRPLVLVLTDGTGAAWRNGAVRQPLREWATYGTVLLIHLLPPEMWSRTALRPVPVVFFPADDGHHRGARVKVGDAGLSVAGLDRGSLPGATAIPVIGLDVPWLKSWLPLLRGSEAGAVPGHALLIPRPDASGQAEGSADGAGLLPPDNVFGRMSPVERVERFGVNASEDAWSLAKLLSVGPFNLNTMRKIQRELVPGSGTAVLGEVLLGGLIYQTSVADGRVPVDEVMFEFYPGVRDLLRERVGGQAELDWDKQRVERALLAESESGSVYGAVAVGLGGRAHAVVPSDASPIATRYVTPTPDPVRLTAPANVTHAESEGETRLARQVSEPVRIGFWGSPSSGRTTFLTVLGLIGWQASRKGGKWRVDPADLPTRRFIDERAENLRNGGAFPDASATPEPLSFQLLHHPRQRRWPMSLFRPARAAEITVTLEDRGGRDFGGDDHSPAALDYLAGTDALVYFFDPTYDMDDDEKFHSFDFFDSMAVGLGKFAAEGQLLHDRFLPQHIAVCIPKLDDPRVFRIARRYGCVQMNPDTKQPWVPDRYAWRLFEALCRDQMTIKADLLLDIIRRTFHPSRISFHVLSSVGFWVRENGQFDPDDACNVEQTGDRGRRVRGKLRPLHVVEPLVSLVERAQEKG
jgi:hypothetical protein